MKSIRVLTIIGVCFVFAMGTLFHFLYEWAGYPYFLGLFIPVNESIWEHMKLLFFPMLLYSFFMKKQLKNTYPFIGASLCAGILTGTLSIPIIFYSYRGILGFHTLVLDILTFALSDLLAFTIVYYCSRSCRLQKSHILLSGMVIVLFLCFMIFTYHPPEIGLFSYNFSENTAITE